MYLIDGHNLLRSVHKLDEELWDLTDVRLCELLDRYLSRCGEQGRIIFDGVGPPDKRVFDGMRHLEVFFSGRGVETDAVIEDRLETDPAPSKLIVVSNDRRLRRAAQSARASVARCEAFWDHIERQLSRKGPPKEPTAKRQGLSEGETEQWLDIFDLDV